MDRINNQPAEKSDLIPNFSLDVHSMWNTIQGEGPHAGRPALFVRLAGCNLQCPFCDTDYTTGRRRYTVGELAYVIAESIRVSSLVVLTGGEPFRQNIEGLVNLLTRQGFEVQIETNGVMYRSWRSGMAVNLVQIVCSPKTAIVHPELTVDKLAAVKYIVQHDNISKVDGLPLSSLGMSQSPARFGGIDRSTVYIQPLDEQDQDRNRLNMEAAVSVCQTFGYRLCLQVQKIVGLP